MGRNVMDISLTTLIEVSPILGHALEDRSYIRDAQDTHLVTRLQAATSKRIDIPDQEKYFYFGSIDFMVYDEAGGKRIQAIEFNGTAMDSISHMPEHDIGLTLETFAGAVKEMEDPVPLVLVPYSGSVVNNKFGKSPRLVYEKIMMAEAFKRGLIERYGAAQIVPLIQLKPGEPFYPKLPTVVIGYSKDFVDYLGWHDGRPLLNNYPITATTHDNLCEHIHKRFNEPFDLSKFHPINRLYPITADKGKSYALMNKYLSVQKFRYFPEKIEFYHVDSVEDLIDMVTEGVSQGKKMVIKPHASGLGRGIDFFTDPHESADSIIEKIDASIRATQQFYAIEGSPFPYTVCRFLEGCTIADPHHSKFGHKYEMRVNIYRHGNMIHAVPTFLKIASRKFDPQVQERLSLLNNIVLPSTDAEGFRLPLANTETLRLVDLTREHLEEMCHFATGFTHFALQHVPEEPEVFYTWCQDLHVTTRLDF